MLKGGRIHHPKICHMGLRIILSRCKKGILISSFLPENRRANSPRERYPPYNQKKRFFNGESKPREFCTNRLCENNFYLPLGSPYISVTSPQLRLLIQPRIKVLMFCLLSGLERSPGEGNGNLLQYSHLENSMDRGAWRAIVHGVTKSRTRLSD